jgi:hypothetical protein
MLAVEEGWYPCRHAAVQWASTQGRLAPGWCLQMAALLGKGAGMHSVHMMAGMQAPGCISCIACLSRVTQAQGGDTVFQQRCQPAPGALYMQAQPCWCVAACCRVLIRHRGVSCMGQVVEYWCSGLAL